MKQSQNSSSQVELEEFPDFSQIETKVFTVHNGNVFIGREKVTPELRALLREQAIYLKSSQIWEILNNTITNEASQLALIQSKNFEEVQSAKMLWHWRHVFSNMIYILSKD